MAQFNKFRTSLFSKSILISIQIITCICLFLCVINFKTDRKYNYNIPQITKINAINYDDTLPTVSKYYEEYKKDTMRFIAHASGMIDNYKYTNCLEALELNYKKGFRLFELDILKTRDGKYVAAHDWEKWKKITNYPDSVPTTYDEFIKYKIYGKYTPLDIEKINNWFKNHPDAILVTDKVNEPKVFAKIFVDPNRLMMELFDMNAVIEGVAIGIKSAMPTQSLIEKMTKSELLTLNTIGVKNIAISRRFILKNTEILKELKSKNIKAYAFHLNFDPGKTEDYVLKYEMDYIYGIYADNWNFSNK